MTPDANAPSETTAIPPVGDELMRTNKVPDQDHHVSLSASFSVSGLTQKPVPKRAPHEIIIKSAAGEPPTAEREIITVSGTKFDEFLTNLQAAIGAAVLGLQAGTQTILKMDAREDWRAWAIDLLVRHRGGTIERVPNAFLDGYGKMPFNPAIYAVTAAIRKGGKRAGILVGGWRQVNDRVIYEHSIKKGGRILVYPRALRRSGTDTKWTELNGLLDDPLMVDEDGHRRKLIVLALSLIPSRRFAHDNACNRHATRKFN